jgi:hypothetical protein
MRLVPLAAASLAVVAGVSTTLGGDVDIRKDRDSHVTVYRTLFGFRFGDPIYDGNLPAGHRLRIREGWLTDLSVTQDLLVSAVHTEHQIAAMEGPDGMVRMAELDPWVRDRYGDEVATIADFGPGTTTIMPVLHVAVDLTQVDPWLWFCPGEVFFSFNGQALGLPGYQFGHLPFDYIEGLGWVNPAPFTGEVEVIGEMGLNAAPWPPNGCNLADVAEPYWVLDLADINRFVQEFLMGCPPDTP